MRLQGGKRLTSSDIGRSAEREVPRRTTSAEWNKWLQEINSHVGSVDKGLRPEDVRPFVEVDLLGRRFVALLDTGSVVNLVGEKVAEHLRLREVVPSKKTTPLRMADGSRSRSELTFRLLGELDGKRWTGDALYIPTLTTDMILGMPVIRDLNLVSVGTKVITMGVGERCSGHVGCLNTVSGADEDPESPVAGGPRLASVVGEASGDLSGVESVGCDPTGPAASGDKELVESANTLIPLTERQNRELSRFLDSELPLFDAIPGKTHLVEHVIRLKEGAVPVKQRHYPRNPAVQAVVDAEMETPSSLNSSGSVWIFFFSPFSFFAPRCWWGV